MTVIKKDDSILVEVPSRTIRFYATDKIGGLKNLLTCTTEIPPGEELPVHKHEKAEETMFFIRGKGEAVLEGDVKVIEAGDFFCVPTGGTHTVRNTGDESLFFCCSFSPQIDVTPYLEQAKKLALGE